MKKSFCVIALTVSSAFASSSAHAMCGIQSVALFSGKSEIARWDVVSAGIHHITLPNGFQLGLQIEPAPATLQADFARRMSKFPDYVPTELVKLALYDLSEGRAREISHNFVGVNSVQEYGRRAGSDGASEMPDVSLHFKKTECTAKK